MIKQLEKLASKINDKVISLRMRRLINFIKNSHYVPGKTNVPVPLARNHDYIGGTFYHGPMSQWKSVDEYREKAKPPVEIWRTDKEENKKYKKRREGEDIKKNKKSLRKNKGIKPSRRAKRLAALKQLMGKI